MIQRAAAAGPLFLPNLILPSNDVGIRGAGGIHRRAFQHPFHCSCWSWSCCSRCCSSCGCGVLRLGHLADAGGGSALLRLASVIQRGLNGAGHVAVAVIGQLQEAERRGEKMDSKAAGRGRLKGWNMRTGRRKGGLARRVEQRIRHKNT